MLAEKRRANRPRRLLGVRLDLRFGRNAVQIVTACLLLVAGVQFYFFVQHFLSGGTAPYVPRPAAVEAFLPIGALVGLRAWLGTGLFDPVHPAGLAILLAILATTLIFGKAFCAWLCPVGALSEALWRLGRRVMGRGYRLPRWADWPLQSLKYLLLLFFLKAVLIDFSPGMAVYFLRSSYNQVADVKMMYFFLQPGTEVVAFLLVLMSLSLVVPNFWCRYLCPYGALLGGLSVLAPAKVKRTPSLCTNCKRCDWACPEGLAVSTADRVHSPQCSRCLDCVVACPKAGALGVSATPRRFFKRPWLYATAYLVAFFGLLFLAQATGNWESSVTYETYARLIPRFDLLNHP